MGQTKIYIYKFIYFIVLHSFIQNYALEKPIKNYIKNFLTQYTRDYTTLEITGANRHTNFISTNFINNHTQDLTAIILTLKGNVKKLLELEQIKQENPQNIIILEPIGLNNQDIDKLASCEQLDFVIIHDVPSYISSTNHDTFEKLLTLGDYVGIDIPAQTKNQGIFNQTNYKKNIIKKIPHMHDSGFFILIKTNKRGLKTSRWSKKSSQNICYPIESTFFKKELFNNFLQKKSVWSRGINLETFIMLSGTYPSNDLLIKELQKFKSLKHNDLVVSNILVQGLYLKPIDFDDKRRAGKINFCLRMLLELIKQRQKKEYVNPQILIREYLGKFKK